MDEQGRQRLVSALGPSLQELQLNFPNEPEGQQTGKQCISTMSSVDHLFHLFQSVNKENDISLVLDRRHFPDLRLLGINLAPFSRKNEITFASFQATISSWVNTCSGELDETSTSERYLTLQPFNYLFARAEFVELLRAIGPVIEAAICKKKIQGNQESEEEEEMATQADSEPHRVTLVVRDLQDRLEWEDWWWQNITECFPTLSQSNRVYVPNTETGK